MLKLANIEIGEIPLAPKLSDIWYQNSELPNKPSRHQAQIGYLPGSQPSDGLARHGPML